ncbi:MAG: GntR family transcriptional regulator [Pseudomonadota bacterium]
MAKDGISKKALCFDDLQRRILTQDLDPGLDLDEVDLAKTYGISRPPVREVLNQLAGEGYVVLRKNRGAQVAPMSHKTLRNFFLAAPMLYAAVAKLAAQNATEAQMMRLKDAQTLFRKAIRDGITSDRALTNQRFHAIIGDMADNEFLTPSYRRLLIDHTRIGMSFYDPRNQALWEQRSVAADQHDLFISMIEQRDDEACGQLAIDHWELSRAEIESFVSPDGIQFPLGGTIGVLKGAHM